MPSAPILDPSLLIVLRFPVNEDDLVFVCGDTIFSQTLPTEQYRAEHCADKPLPTLAQRSELAALFQQQTNSAAELYEEFALSFNDKRKHFTRDVSALSAPMIATYQEWLQLFQCADLKKEVAVCFEAFCRKGSINSMAIVAPCCAWMLGVCMLLIGYRAYGTWRCERLPLEKQWVEKTSPGDCIIHSTGESVQSLDSPEEKSRGEFMKGF